MQMDLKMNHCNIGKTAVTVLQEYMMKLNESLEYECIPQPGTEHHAIYFQYNCKVCDVMVTASARSKKESKQQAARLMLYQLAMRGYPVPDNFLMPQPMPAEAKIVPLPGATPRKCSYVMLLKELCDVYRMSGVEYELVRVTGLSHFLHFTIRARKGFIERLGTATSKKKAKQVAAEQLYHYLLQNLSGIKREMGKNNMTPLQRNMRIAGVPTRADDSDVDSLIYHLGLTARLDARTRKRTYVALERSKIMSPKRGLAIVAAALRLKVVYNTSEGGSHSVILKTCSPDVVFTGQDQTSAASNAIHYLRLTLSPYDEDFAALSESEDDAVPGVSSSQ